MNNRVTGLSLIAVSVASIAYQAYKNHREAQRGLCEVH